MPSLFGEAFENTCRKEPLKPALTEAGRSLSYGDLHDRAQRLAQELARRDLKPGTVIGAIHDQAIPMAVLFLACQYAGLGLAPLNTGLTAGEIQKVMAKIGATMIVANPRLTAVTSTWDSQGFPSVVITLDDVTSPAAFEAFLAGLPPAAERPQSLPTDLDPEGVALVISSSGSMGSPKCVRISRAGYARQIMRQSKAGQVRHDDVFQLNLPLFHAAGLIGVLGVSFAQGASVAAHLGPFRADEVLAHLTTSGATLTHWIPTMIARVVDHLARTLPAGRPAAIGRLRAIHFGSMPMHEDVLAEAIQRFPGMLWPSYGTTECGFISYLPPDILETEPGLTGRIAPESGARIITPDGDDVAIGESGEIVTPLTRASMTDYIGDPDLTARVIRDGLVHSGDIAINKGDGYFTILGRIDAVIVTGGLKVYPSEVENCISTHVQCAEVAVIGVPEPEFGEIVCAVLPSDRQDLTLDRLREICRSHLASYKLPRQVAFVDGLPRTSTGKVAYGQLRQLFGSVRTR